MTSDVYQYDFVETSPLFVLISEKLYLFIAKLIPTWIHPNWLTILTLLLTLTTFVLFTLYDYSFLASSWFYTEIDSVPDWLWLWTVVGFTLEYLLDGVDGVYARLTKQTSKVGEFLDHSTDILRLNLVQPFVFFSLFGREDFGLPASSMLLTLLAIQCVTFCTFLFQRITGKLFLPWCYDLNHFYMIFVFFKTWWGGGSEVWKHRPYKGTTNVSNAEIIYYGILVNCLVVSLPMQLWMFYKFLKQKGLTFRSIIGHLPSVVWFIGVALISLSVCHGIRLDKQCILNIEPRIVFLAYSLTLSNICLKSLRERMLNLPPSAMDWLSLGCMLMTVVPKLLPVATDQQLNVAYVLCCLQTVASGLFILRNYFLTLNLIRFKNL